MSSTNQRRYRALDGLRGIAALCVIFYHALWNTHLSGLRIVSNAYLAVDFFFILSGFVIAANYSGKIADFASARAFMILRFFRLYPLHLAVLAGLFAVEVLKFSLRGAFVSDVAPFTGPNSPRLLIENLLMAQGLGPESQLGWNSPSWSIGAEFVAYLLFAAAAIAGLARRREIVAALAGLALAA